MKIRRSLRVEHYNMRIEEGCVTRVEHFILIRGKHIRVTLGTMLFAPPANLIGRREATISTEGRVLSIPTFLYR